MADYNYPTRKDYMAHRVTHQEYYEAIAAEAGISYNDSDLLPRVKAALEAGDEYLNSIPLRIWDMRATCTRYAVSPVLKAHDDFYSQDGGVCVHKAAALKAARDTSTNA